MSSFWSDPNVEPKRKYRWVMFIGGIPQWLLKKAAKPSFKLSKSEHTYINHKFYYPARLEWNPIAVTLADPVSPDAAKTMMDILTASGYHRPENPNDTSTVSKARAIAALGRVVIQQLGPDSEVIEEWELVNGWISDVKFGELDYTSDDMVDTEIEIVYDYAKMNVSGDPVPVEGI